MIVLAIFGLWLPGYVLARAMRAPLAWAVAFPLSAVLLTEIVIAYAAFNVTICFGSVLAAVAGVSLLAAVVWFLRRKSEPEIVDSVECVGQRETPSGMARALRTVIVVLVGLILLGMLVRNILFPLCGLDTPYRWDALARVMLKYESLSYYPAFTADDLTKYIYPDGIPPLTSAVYWWLYAAWGEPCPAVTSVSIFLQAASCFALVYYGACVLFGRAGGWVAVGALASSSLFLTGVLIGQETGYTAICYAGQFAFAFAAVRKPKASLVVIAGLFGVVGALSREYGLAMPLCGFVVLASQRNTWRYLPLFFLVVAVGGVPWYLRNWVITGNPLYPMDVLGFPSIPVRNGLMSNFGNLRGIQTFSMWTWLHLAAYILANGSLALVLGIPGIARARRMAIPFGVSTVLIILLWLWSIPFTDGGIVYSLRVLTPAWVALSIAAGALIHWFTQRCEKTRTILLVAAMPAVVACGGYATLVCWTYTSNPHGTEDYLAAIVSTRTDPLDMCETGAVAMAKYLENTGLPPGGILTDDVYFAIALQRYTRFYPVMVWSPAVAYLFDRRLSPPQMEKRLVADRVWSVSLDDGSFHNAYLCRFPFFYEFLCQDGRTIEQVSTGDPITKQIFHLVTTTTPKAENQRKR